MRRSRPEAVRTTCVDHFGAFATEIAWPGRYGSTGKPSAPDQIAVGRLVRNDGGTKGVMDKRRPLPGLFGCEVLDFGGGAGLDWPPGLAQAVFMPARPISWSTVESGFLLPRRKDWKEPASIALML